MIVLPVVSSANRAVARAVSMTGVKSSSAMWVTPGPADQAGGEDAALVGLLGLLDAVGGHQDGAGEGGELLGLVLPGPAVVAVEVGVFLQFRVAVAGQHLAVGVDVDALALGLLQQELAGPSGRGRRRGWPCPFWRPGAPWWARDGRRCRCCPHPAVPWPAG